MASLRSCHRFNRMIAGGPARSIKDVAGDVSMPFPLSVSDLMEWLGPTPEFAPRPFYVVGHNPNSIAEVESALKLGANAIEPDVNMYLLAPNATCISHDLGSLGDVPEAVEVQA